MNPSPVKSGKRVPESLRHLLNVTAPGNGREGTRSQLSQLPTVSDAHFPPQQLPSMVIFWTPVVAFLGTLQNHLEKECSQAWFDQTWLWKERDKRLELRAPTPFHSGHLKLLSCLLIGPTLSHISGHGDVPWPRLLTDSCPFICGWCVATMGCR